jgi:5-methylcytosine-specific restriction endonuclease McrA
LKRNTFNGGEWTPARFRSFVTGALRTATRRWPPKYQALKDALVGRKVNKKTGKLAMHYSCAECSKEFVSGDVQVDHKEPAVDPATGFVSWDVYVDRLYCEASNLQVLCLPCHKKKTAEEKLLRKKK